MEKNRDTQTWFWEFPGNVKLTVPSADFKRGGKELLQAVRKIFGDGLKDMYLQDVHYNLPVGANRIRLENNMTALLTEYVDRHPLKSYRTLAEDDKFVVIGDTLSPDIRAYRKLSENEVSKVLHEYATKEDLSLVPMDKELQVLASKIEQKGKVPKYYSQVAYLQMSDDTSEFDKLQDRKVYKGLLNLAAMLTKSQAELKEKTANEKHEETKQHRPPQMITVNGEKVTHAHAFQSNKKPDDWFFTAKLDGQQLRPQHMKPEDVKAYQDHTSTVENLMQTYYPSKVAKKVSPEEYKADNKLSDGRVVDKIFVYKEHDENRPDVGKYKLYAQVGDLKMSRTLSTEDLNAFFDRVTTPAKLVEKNFGEHLHLASAYQKYQLPENSGVEKVSIHKNQEGTYVISASMGDKGVTPERKVEWNDLYSYFKAKTATRSQLAAKYLMDDIRSVQTIKNDVTRGLKV